MDILWEQEGQSVQSGYLWVEAGDRYHDTDNTY